MSAPFVAQIRSRPHAIRLGAEGAAFITVRVQVAEVWDVLRVEAPATESVLAVKERALAVLVPEARYHDEFVVKLNGFEILDERASLADAGVKDGSTLLIGYRRRRPVR